MLRSSRCLFAVAAFLLLDVELRCRGAAPEKAWEQISFENSTARARNSRNAAAWRQTRSIHIDLLIGNYLSHYFEELAAAITNGAPRFIRPRRHDNMRFYSKCLPAMIPLRPWPVQMPHVRPAGRWDWFVFDNATAAFWRSMRPIVRYVLDRAFASCGLRATVPAPVLHFRCASAPLNRHSQYHFQRYSFYRAAARRYRRSHGRPLRELHLLTCVADDVQQAAQASTCKSYLDDLVAFLSRELGIVVRVHNCAHSMFEDFAIMYAAPFLISTGSTMSLLPGLARHVERATFVSPLLYDEESVAYNGRAPLRRMGCAACEWMLARDHSLCHCEVANYAHVPAVLPLLQQPPPPLSAAAGTHPSSRRVCARCAAVECAKFRPLACELALPAAVEQGARGGVGRTKAVHAAGCRQAGARVMSAAECQESADRPHHARKWLGASRNDDEAAGCVLWEDGNVEFNSRPADAQVCNVRGTCLCSRDGAELPVVGLKLT